MPNYKEIARLKAAGQSNRAIADFLGLSRNTVNAAVARIEDSGLRFEDLQILTDAQINEVFPPTSGRKVEGEYYMPDFEQLKKELAKPGVTLQLLWEEYSDRCRLSGLKPYQLTQFKKHFNDHLKKTGFKDIIQHKAGEQIEVDWAGVRPYWQDPDSGEKVYGWLFAAVLPFSGLGFAYVTPDMKMPSWIQCHIKMYEFFGGVTTILTPDNLKTGITKHTRDELVINSTYQDMAEYYGTVVVPARVRTPRDKNQVENLVYQFEKDVIGRLRNCQFFSIDEYNDQLLLEVERFNNKPYQKKEGTRRSVFNEVEKATLRPLPVRRYEMATYRTAIVQSNSHVAYQKNYYSVPYQYLGKEVTLKITSHHLTILYNKNVLSEHELLWNKIGAYSTIPTDMPPHSNAYGEWNSTRYLNWARIKDRTYMK
ncbi:MAG: IS21 family transposase [Clostridiales bacterium]|nr:IS21 family transposase [Clostridiales bacterium]